CLILLAPLFLSDFLRQQVAAVFILLGFFSIYKKHSHIRLILYVAVASLFHISALVVLPFSLLYRSKVIRFCLLGLAGVFLILSFFGFGIADVLGLLKGSSLSK